VRLKGAVAKHLKDAKQLSEEQPLRHISCCDLFGTKSQLISFLIKAYQYCKDRE